MIPVCSSTSERERQRWPVDLMNGRRRGFVKQRDGIIEAELAMPSEDGPAFQSDYPLDYHADGYPKLPDSLRRTAEQERFNDPLDVETSARAA
jgi:hypothetical protein